MKPASIDDIKKELKELPPKEVLGLTLRMARFKKENKELLTYLLFESGNEAGYIESLQLEMNEMISTIKKGPASPIKKQLRKILRMISRQTKYIGNKNAPVELLLHFCVKLKEHTDDLLSLSGVYSLYDQQLNKIRKLVPLVDEDLQFDYNQKLKSLQMHANEKGSEWWRIRRKK